MQSFNSIALVSNIIWIFPPSLVLYIVFQLHTIDLLLSLHDYHEYPEIIMTLPSPFTQLTRKLFITNTEKIFVKFSFE